MMEHVKLPNSVKVVIIGGGVIGASVAYHLAERGCKDVLLLEKDGIAAHSSHKAAGQLYRGAMTDTTFEIILRCFSLYEKFHANGDIELHGNRILIPVREKDPEMLKTAVRSYPQMGERFGAAVAEYLDDPEKCFQAIPDLKTTNIRNLGNLEGALYTARDAWVDPYLMTMAYIKHARRMGVDIRTRVKVEDVIVEGGKVRGVETAAGRVKCEYVVNAAGGWASKIGEMAGLEMPVKPCRASLIKIQLKEEKEYEMGMYFDVFESMTERQGLWIRDDIVGYVAGGDHDPLGLGTTVDPDDYNEGYTYEDVMKLADKLEEFMPGFGDFEVVDGWAGIYGNVGDANWLIDSVDNPEGFVICAGFCGEGIHASAAAGLLASELILDGKIKSVKDPSQWAYNTRRFR